MKKHISKILFVLSTVGLLCSCGSSSSSSVASSNGGNASSANTTSSSSASETSLKTNSNASSEDSSAVESTSEESVSSQISVPEGGFVIVNAETQETPSYTDNVYTIDEGGTYSLAGTFEGMIYIDVAETDDKSGEVTLELNGVELSNDANSVIYCASADGLDISAQKGTVNTITDLRAVQTEEDEEQGGGVIYSKVDTKLKGKGQLSVVGTYNNGIHVTKDLEIKNLTLESKAINNAIKGNDSLTIESGTITAISTGGDGLKTEDSDISSKGNQRGDVQILGGNVEIYSACDGIQAAHDFVLGQAGSDVGPNVEIYTNKYSSYTNESDIISSSTETMYLRTTTNSSSLRYAVYFYNNAGDEGVWSNATYKTSQTSGGWGGRGTTYYYYELERPSSYLSFQIYAFRSTETENSTTDYVAKSSGNTINTSADTVTFSTSGSSITTSGWSTYSSSTGGGPGGPGFPGGEGNTDKADVSAKGVKAQNNIYTYSGSLNIKAYDDGLHANYGETLDSGVTSTGDVYLAGGEVTIYASDDGVHADRHLYIQGGKTTVTNSYEGLEGNQIHVSGGTAVAYGSDDGVNAGSGSLTPLIEVTGGHLFAAVPTNGDTDGIDSNGNFTQTGGEVIVAGPAGGMASALDTDGSVTVRGGSLIVFGGVEKSVSASSGITSGTKSGTYSNKSYTVTFASGSVVTEKLPNYNYSTCRTWSELGSLSSVN